MKRKTSIVLNARTSTSFDGNAREAAFSRHSKGNHKMGGTAESHGTSFVLVTILVLALNSHRIQHNTIEDHDSATLSP